MPGWRRLHSAPKIIDVDVDVDVVAVAAPAPAVPFTVNLVLVLARSLARPTLFVHSRRLLRPAPPPPPPRRRLPRAQPAHLPTPRPKTSAPQHFTPPSSTPPSPPPSPSFLVAFALHPLLIYNLLP